MFKSIISFIVRRPWTVIVAWTLLISTVVAVALVGVGGETLFSKMKNNAPSVSSESKMGADILKEVKTDGSPSETIFILAENIKYENPPQNINIFYNDIQKFSYEKKYTFVSPKGVSKEIIASQPSLLTMVAEDKFMSILVVNGDTKEELDANVLKAEEEIAKHLEEVNLTGNQTITYSDQSSLVASIMVQAESDLSKGELIALPVALLVLVLVFGGLLAAGMPLLGAIVSIVASLGTLYGMSYFLDIETSLLNVLTVIGLGLSIDYGLLMISRFRETLRSIHKRTKNRVQKAVEKTIATAGRTVMVSGVTVATATLTLVLFEPMLMKTIGIAATSVVLLAILSSTTLLPAIFVLLGDRLIKPSFLTKLKGVGKAFTAFGDVSPKSGAFSKLATSVQKHRWVATFASIAVLVLLSIPVLSMTVSNMGVDKLPVGTNAGIVFTSLKKDFSSLQGADVSIVIDEDNAMVTNQIQGYVNSLKDTVEGSVSRDKYENTFVVKLNSDNASNTVKDVRNYISTELSKDKAKIYVTGEAAQDIDYVKSLADTAPWVAIIIILVTAFLLFLMTGSLWIPIKAVVLSGLSLTASMGVITAGFQDGLFAEVLNFDASRITGIDPLMVVLTLVFGFGLAMDYEMFLISRIKEAHVNGSSTNEAVRNGLQASGRIITTAALMIVIVFFGFAMGDMLMIKMMGVALALAVIIDATIVRMILVPAIFAMLGEKIWWSPKWLTKVHDKIGLEH